MSQVFSIHRQVEFNHCDPAGMVYYPRYFEMISALTERFFADALDYAWSSMGEAAIGNGTPMGRIEVHFMSPSFLGDWLELTLGVARIGTASATFEIACLGAGERRFFCRATVVHAKIGGGRSVPWPAPVRAAMTPYLIPSDETAKKTRTCPP
ncbi:thioesterase family protein [Psychromarinibacter sp. C21-152]|uniref:Thioesterase family protein n=1 Tax=Psychromarinibacter sediminicola TaxID=3033385 RepID=A0AAE3NPM7_9RHOB|nr:thioesterase family protein [Psychromarinibacter sediminicola]MDF0599712.1 thioesterase family protein [Psychromarinibacter sediminicola]